MSDITQQSMALLDAERLSADGAEAAYTCDCIESRWSVPWPVKPCVDELPTVAEKHFRQCTNISTNKIDI